MVATERSTLVLSTLGMACLSAAGVGGVGAGGDGGGARLHAHSVSQQRRCPSQGRRLACNRLKPGDGQGVRGGDWPAPPALAGHCVDTAATHPT